MATPKYCPECGTALREGLRFCPECGTALPEVTLEGADGMETDAQGSETADETTPQTPAASAPLAQGSLSPEGDFETAASDAATQMPAPRFCQACGAELAAGTLFCSRCGTRAGEATRPGTAALQQDGDVEEAPRTKKRKLWLIPVIIGGALVLLLLTGVIVFLQATKLRGLDMKETAVVLSEGDTRWLYTDTVPSYARQGRMTWESSDPAVATVDAYGQVTAVGKGSCTITVDAGNGIGASCEVTVQPVATGITLVDEGFWMLPGDVETIAYTLEPADAVAAVDFASSDSSVATVDAYGQVTAVTPGSCTITVSAGNGLSAVCEILVADMDEAGKRAIVGNWNCVGFADYSVDEEFHDGDGYSSITVDADGNGTMTLADYTYDVTGCVYAGADTDDGDYNYYLTINGGDFYAFISNDPTYPATMDCLFLIVTDANGDMAGYIVYAKS